MHDQVILFGAPGTGKSYEIKERLAAYGDDKKFRVTIHPEFLYTDFVGIDSAISEMIEQKEYKKAITRTNLFKFWKKVVGEKFQDNSKPYSMTTNSVMIIACKSSTVAQELMLRKTKILNDIEPYLKSLKMNIKDLRFDVKRWTDEN